MEENARLEEIIKKKFRVLLELSGDLTKEAKIEHLKSLICLLDKSYINIVIETLEDDGSITVYRRDGL